MGCEIFVKLALLICFIAGTFACSSMQENRPRIPDLYVVGNFLQRSFAALNNLLSSVRERPGPLSLTMTFGDMTWIEHCRMQRIVDAEEYNCNGITIPAYFYRKRSRNVEWNFWIIKVIHFADIKVNITGRMEPGSKNRGCTIDTLTLTTEAEQNIADVSLPMDYLRKTLVWNLIYLESKIPGAC
nr:unnamed protein product [Spirometra erinaceieuropaei]